MAQHGPCPKDDTAGCVNPKVNQNWVMVMDENEHEFVLVIWADAHAGSGHWAELDTEDLDEHLVQSVGMLVTDQDGGKPKHITLAQSKSPDGFYDHVIHIPNQMMREIKFLKPWTKGLTISA